MVNDYYHNMVTKQYVAEMRAQADQDRLAKEVRALRRKVRAEQRAAAELRAAVEGPVRRRPINALKAWLGLSIDTGRPVQTAAEDAGQTVAIEDPICPTDAEPHPAAARS